MSHGIRKSDKLLFLCYSYLYMVIILFKLTRSKFILKEGIETPTNIRDTILEIYDVETALLGFV